MPSVWPSASSARPGSILTEGHRLRRVTTHDSQQRDLVAELRIGFLQSASLAGWGDKLIGAGARRHAETPEQVATLFVEYLETGDLDGLVSLYEPGAHFDPAPGTHLVGTAAIRKALQQLIDSGARLKPEPRATRRVDDLALVSNTATLTEATPDGNPVISMTTEILRRQPDGGWVHVVDDPFFG
jgi:ketosteroid isomerase-like protein